MVVISLQIIIMARKLKPKGHKYWSEKQERLCCEWLTASTQQEYTRIYNAIIPAMNFLVNSIMQRYFSVNPSEQLVLQNDVITFIFLRLQKYEPDKAKAYSFCGTIAKNHMHELLVRQPQAINKVNFEYTDEEAGFVTGQDLDYGSHIEHDFKAIDRYFEEKQVDAQQKLDSLVKRKREGFKKGYNPLDYHKQYRRLKEKVITCKLCREFMSRFESINTSDMAEYVFLNSDMKRDTVSAYFTSIYGFKVMLRRDNFGIADDRKGYNHLNDDWTPADNKWRKRMHRKKANEKGNGYGYF